jgi:hypothetical protein
VRFCCRVLALLVAWDFYRHLGRFSRKYPRRMPELGKFKAMADPLGNAGKQTRRKILARKILARTRSYRFLTRQNVRTSSAMLWTPLIKAGLAGERCSKYPLFELRPVLNLGMAMEAV